jgi:hypothetical protein
LAVQPCVYELKIGGLNTHQNFRALKVSRLWGQFASNENVRFRAC